MQLPEVAALLSFAALDDAYKVASCDEVLQKTGAVIRTFHHRVSHYDAGFVETTQLTGLSIFGFLKNKEYICVQEFQLLLQSLDLKTDDRSLLPGKILYWKIRF